MLQVFFIDDDKPTTIVNKRLAIRSKLFDRVEVFNHSTKAFDYIKENLDIPENLPDLIFLDVNMPAFNGWEFLEAFKKLESSKKIHVVMLSTSDSGKIATTSMSCCQDLSFYETKPLNVDKIKKHATRVSNCLNNLDR